MKKMLLAGLFPLLASLPSSAQTGAERPWFFAVSGDSRDCGDLVMPKIARSIRDQAAAHPIDFYWHLGDFRRIYDIDCDILKREHPSFRCENPRRDKLAADEMNRYLDGAWDDFKMRQLAPFAAVPVFLGIGNHELYANRTHDDFRKAFQKWLTREPIHAQRMADAARGIFGEEADTYYHFVHQGVDFITLDNAEGSAFGPAQILWLTKVLAADAKDDAIRAIVVGAHEALPGSTASYHAMDATCAGFCSGSQVYEMLYRAQNLDGPPEKRKHVYLFASHSHEFKTDVFDTPDHRGRVLPGWVIGTAGAEQYTEAIRYGYLRVAVGADGELAPEFVEITRDSPPAASGPGAASLTDFCFASNKRKIDRGRTFAGECACGAAK
jgi:Calcineurin-like phosphoesterase